MKTKSPTSQRLVRRSAGGKKASLKMTRQDLQQGIADFKNQGRTATQLPAQPNSKAPLIIETTDPLDFLKG